MGRGYFNYKIEGGIEDGEAQHWNLEPNLLSDWDDAQNPKDAEFTVKVVQLDGIGGKTLWKIKYDENAEKELTKLLEEYPEFK